MLFITRVNILIFAILFTSVASKCRKSYMTICDTFEDFERYKDFENLSQLMIGSENGKLNLTSVHLMNTLRFNSYPKLSSLFVVRAVNNLETTYGYQCAYHTSALKYVTFYGNELKTLTSYTFPVVALKKLSLVNNKIEAIKEWTLKPLDCEEVDLSDNLLEVMESEALSDKTKILTVKNNKLTHLDPRSLPSELESLNLENNKLRYIQDDVLNSLQNMRDLTLSRNKFNAIPKISHMKELVVFDISFNSISTVEEGTFKDMEKLKLLDLGNNQIGSVLILKSIYTPSKQTTLTISLAMNRLKSLNLDNMSLENQTFVFYGNPWDCNTWPQLKKQLQGHESECDVKFLAGGSVPYCINYHSGGSPFVSWRERDYERFYDAVRESEENATCSLAAKKLQWLHPASLGCVA